MSKYRAKNLKNRYGMDIAEYDALLAKQNGRCDICKETMSQPQVDHCHDSGAVRALLCGDCNTGIARLREDPRIIHAALQYVVRHSSHRMNTYETPAPADPPGED